MFRLTNVIPERIIFVSRGITVFRTIKCLLVTDEERRVSVLPSPLLSSYRRKYPDEYEDFNARALKLPDINRIKFKN